jgi:hypothetical protein
VAKDKPYLSPAGDAANTPPSNTDPSLEALREILLGHYRRQIAELQAELDDLERRINDKDALIATIAPVMGDAIRRKIRDAREEMIEAFYPIIGQVVLRAVSEAIDDLRRMVDAQVRTSFNPQATWWRLRARIGGASDADIALRESLPFEVEEIFLVHRDTGLLLRHISRASDTSTDSELISGMLTAIRDFTHDTFGRGREGELEEIEYGDQRILIEDAQHAYLAVVVDGIEPPGFWAEMRERIIEVEHTHQQALRHYDGDATPFASVEPALRSLMIPATPRELSPTQKRILAGVLGIAAVFLLGACLVAGWVWRVVRSPSTPVPVAVAPMPASTPTSSPPPTVAASPMPTATSWSTITPTPTLIGLITGNVPLFAEPSFDSQRLGLILEQGQWVEILALFDDWYRVRWTPDAQTEVIGWVPGIWVGPATRIPLHMVTPTAGP